MNKLLNYSFLEKSNSSGWKGILILLVVLGIIAFYVSLV